MFRTKYTISLLDSKWQPLKRNLKVDVIPRANEFLYMDDKYHKIINVIHTLDGKQEIFIIIEDLATSISHDNQQVTN